MTELIIELLEILEKECKNYKYWQENKPLIIKINIGDDE